MSVTENEPAETARSQRRRNIGRLAGDCLRVLMAAVLLAVAIGYISWSDTPEVRYRKYYNRIYTMIYGETGPVDIALIGTSRAQCMIGAHEWSRVAFGDQSASHVVYSFATSQRGKDFHYVVLRDLLERRPVRHIVMEFDGTDPRPDYYAHPWFSMIARHADIWRSVMYDDGRPWEQRIRTGVQMFMKKHVSLLEDYLLGISFVAPKAATVPAATEDLVPANPIRPPSLAIGLSKGSIEQAVSGGESWDFNSPRERRNSNFIEAIEADAKQHGSAVDFVYIPTLMQPVLAPGMVAGIEADFGGRVLQPGSHDLPQLYPAAFADFTHGREIGRKLFADLVAPKMKGQLQTPK